MLPRNFPRAPVAFLSALLSPLAWQFGRPDLFDTYSVGILLMQLCGERMCSPCRLYNVIVICRKQNSFTDCVLIRCLHACIKGVTTACDASRQARWRLCFTPFTGTTHSVCLTLRCCKLKFQTC